MYSLSFIEMQSTYLHCDIPHRPSMNDYPWTILSTWKQSIVEDNQLASAPFEYLQEEGNTNGICPVSLVIVFHIQIEFIKFKRFRFAQS